MRESLEKLLSELESFGKDNDRATDDHARRMLNITRDTGEFLSVLARAIRAKEILEIGTSNGFSTLWLAEAASATGGHVTTVEISEFKTALAQKNFQRSGLTPYITQIHDDAGRVLADAPDATFDLVFLGSDRTRYLAWWPEVRRVLSSGGLLVADNATTHPQEIAPFAALVTAERGFTTCVVPVGNGEFLAARTPRPG